MKVLRAVTPLELVATNLLGPLPETNKRDKYIRVVNDQFSKITRAIPLKHMTSTVFAEDLFIQWEYWYGPPIYLRMNNGFSLDSKFLH